MARLQQLLGQSLVQSLGLRDVLAQREQETQQLAQTQLLGSQLRGAQEASAITRSAARKRGIFETFGTVLGATGGAIFGGGIGGAQVGAKLGQAAGAAFSGKRAQPGTSDVSGLIQEGLSLGEKLGEQQASQLEQKKIAADIGLTQAKTRELLAKEDIKPKTLSVENAAKLAGAQEGALGIKGILEGIEKGEITKSDFLASSLPLARRSPGFQKVTDALNFNKEILARVFSGAAVPETEQKRFQEIFSVLPTDSLSVIQKKLQRNINIVDKLQESVLVGATLQDGILSTPDADKIIKEINKTSFPASGTIIQFDSSGRRIN